MNSIGSHQSYNYKTNEWLTPPFIIEALGAFDTDPCSPIVRPWDTALNHYNINTDGLNRSWDSFGRVWLNPPYGNNTKKWMQKLANHQNGIALIFARTETSIFFPHIWEKAHSILFIKGRLFFYNINGIRAEANAGAPSCLVAYGKENTAALRQCGIPGKLIELGNTSKTIDETFLF